MNLKRYGVSRKFWEVFKSEKLSDFSKIFQRKSFGNQKKNLIFQKDFKEKVSEILKKMIFQKKSKKKFRKS